MLPSFTSLTYKHSRSFTSSCALQFFCDEHFLYTTFLGPYLPKDRPVTVVDAGANIGLASILYSQVINFNGEVLAIEANPSTLQVRPEDEQICCVSVLTSRAISSLTFLSSVQIRFNLRIILAIGRSVIACPCL